MFAKVLKPIKYVNGVIKYCIDYISITDDEELLRLNEFGYVVIWIK